MKKIMKLLPIICLFVFLCGVTVSADSVKNEQEITANVVKLGTEVIQNYTSYTYNYTTANTVTIGSTLYYGKIVPIQVTEAGRLHLAFGDSQSLSAYMSVALYNEACARVGYITSTNSAQSLTNKDVYVDVSAPGKYYIVMYTGTYYDEFTSNTVSFRPYVVGTSYGSTLVSVSGDAGKTRNVTFYRYDSSVSGKELYIKYQAKAAGYVTITPKVGSGYVTLCNSKKKELNDQEALNADTNYTYGKKVTYGVAKGTYYIKVKTYDDRFSLNLKLTKISESSGSSKKKAKTIAVNKTRKGTIVAGNNKVDWYKFKLTKSSKVTINVSGATDGSFKITVYKGNSSKGYTYLYDDFSAKLQSVKQFSSTRTKFAKGTYYIKVERYYAKSSGYYSIKWQKK